MGHFLFSVRWCGEDSLIMWSLLLSETRTRRYFSGIQGGCRGRVSRKACASKRVCVMSWSYSIKALIDISAACRRVDVSKHACLISCTGCIIGFISCLHALDLAFESECGIVI